ncbi:thiamine pyrophosphate-dependent enzyme [Nocardia sp. NBC_01377]|uniref:thiamine pyrophosphate-dependent enzyme n=1 Tax=Nocardia sp. NBC_01377 TaxID=2903595 RepID=UPI003865ECEC
MSRSESELDQRLREGIAALVGPSAPPSDRAVAPGVSGEAILELFQAQATSRQLDLAARRLSSARRGYYSIGSSGHEGNAAVSAALRTTDPALLHYRSGAFFVHRARRVPELDPILDVLLGVVAAAADPISGGRHKVYGSKAANIIPQTSTVASHLPRAVGLAFSLERAARLGVSSEWPADSVVLCSFGDASANHSTATGAINAAVHTAHQGVAVPVLFLCEDNGIGLSVPTPSDWIESAYGSRPGLRYFDADGCDPVDAMTTAAAAVEWVRKNRKPAFFRMRTVRLLGHAGSDVESAYRSPGDIAADLERDPVLATARVLVGTGTATPQEILARYDLITHLVSVTAQTVWTKPKLASATAVTAPIAAANPDDVRADVLRTTEPADTEAVATETADPEAVGTEAVASKAVATKAAASKAAASMPADSSANGSAAEPDPMTLAQAINHTLAELLDRDRDILVFGEDVARKGGVYGVTKGLRKRFSARRVFDTLLDEQSVLGTALGAGLAGFVPIPEIQYLAYVHNALDQLRGEAATLSYFSDGRYRNPMVVRIAGLAYQKGFGGHFHNDNSVAALRDIPGLVVAVPSRADDAAAMLRTCVSAARVDGRVCVFLEPIALYHARDLHPGDKGWLASGSPADHVEIGRARIHGDGTDLTIVTFANGVPMSLRVAHRFAERGIKVRVLDLRWLNPLPVEDLILHARATGRVLVADETRRSGGVSESVVTALLDAGFEGRIARVTSEDSFVPLGPAADNVLLDEAAIESAADTILGTTNRRGVTLMRRFRSPTRSR